VKLRQIQSLEVIVVIAVTAAVFGYEQSLGPISRMTFDETYGAVPTRMWDAWRAMREGGVSAEVLRAAAPLLTANFLHADVMHIAMNMLFLWVFGNVVRQVAGRTLFLVLYLLAGIVAVLVHVRTNPTSDVPMVGASGAIAGLEGAYFAFAFRWEVPHASVWPLEGPQPPWRLAIVALLNFFTDTTAFFGRARDSVAYGAHVGGFLGGAILAMIVASLWRPKWRGAT
jgi:membrane associated rhomboid family serine protease